MFSKSMIAQAAALAGKLHKLKEVLVVNRAEARDPESGQLICRVTVASAAEPNGPAYSVIVDAGGELVPASPRLARLFERRVLSTGAVAGAVPRAAPIVVQPDTNRLTLNPDDVLEETITVTIPKQAGPVKADVYFLADTTGSMETVIAAVKAGANNMLTAMAALGADLVFGVGNYRDFASGDPYAFQHQVSPTSAVATVTAAINAWTAVGGSDYQEAGLFALSSLAVPPDGTIGWRPGSKRIIVWFGDAPGHDPICTAVSGEPTVTEASATAKLVAEGITVLAISTADPGLDDDPRIGATDYVAQCGPPDGMPGQGTRIAAATGGVFATGIDAGNIVNTIIDLVTAAIGAIQNVKLVPSASVAPFVVSISPAAGYGPLAGDQEHVLKYDVKFAGIPCKSQDQRISGTIDVVADGTIVAAKKVHITVPPCRYVYSVKFLCGVQPDCGCECAPLQPGKYATEINLHNYSAKPVEVIKRFVPVVLASAPVAREPRVARVHAEDKIVVPPHAATMDDCCRVAQGLFGCQPQSPIPLTTGFLELTASAEIAVTAVYTAYDPKSGGISLAVEQIIGRQL